MHQSLPLTEITQVNRIKTYRSKRKLDYTFQHAHLHVEVVQAAKRGQRVQSGKRHGVPGKQHIAKLPATIVNLPIAVPLTCIHVQAWPVDPIVIGQQLSQHGWLVHHTAPCPVSFDLIQSNYICPVYRLGDSLRAKATISAFSIVNVVRD